MPEVLFLETRTVKDEEARTFEAGEVYDLPRASAERWIRRGVATDDPDKIASAKNPDPLPETKRPDSKPSASSFGKAEAGVADPSENTKAGQEAKKEEEEKMEDIKGAARPAPNAMTSKDFPSPNPSPKK